MIDLSTKYLGLSLQNPIIVGSSGLTDSVDKILHLESAGAGAVVIKSLFEEQIKIDAGLMISQADYPEAMDYLNNYTRNNALDVYLDMIREAKKKVKIPIIASINCVSSSEWFSFASAIQDAGADAIELNVYIIPQELYPVEGNYERIYFEIMERLRSKLSIPISVKLGQHFTNIPSLVDSLYGRGAKGVVLFNRFYAPDIDIDTMSFTTTKVLSKPDDLRNSLRWVGIVSALVEEVDICASTGIHDGNAVVKQILAGATAVQVCSTLYIKGPDYITQILEDLKNWMRKFNFKSLDDFRGRMNYKNIPDPAIFERVQFMKYFSNME